MTSRNFCCVAIIIAVSAALAAWSYFVQQLTIMDLWIAVLTQPALAPECNALHMRDRGRLIQHRVLSSQQCAAIQNIQSMHIGHPPKAKDWGHKLFESFTSHYLRDWQHSDGGEAAKEIVASVITLQKALLNDSGNSVLQAHDISLRCNINLSRPITVWDRWSWLWTSNDLVAEFESGSQLPHGDNCSIKIMPSAKASQASLFCSEEKLHHGFCCGARMYTASVYLNQPGEVDGGRFLFWDHDLMDLWRLRTGFCHVKPECGTMVMFPSDGNHIHAVTPVVRGDRSAIMTWYTNDQNTALEDKIQTPFSEWQSAQQHLQQTLKPQESEMDDIAAFLANEPATGPDYRGAVPKGFSDAWHDAFGYIAHGYEVDVNGQLVQVSET